MDSQNQLLTLKIGHHIDTIPSRVLKILLPNYDQMVFLNTSDFVELKVSEYFEIIQEWRAKWIYASKLFLNLDSSSQSLILHQIRHIEFPFFNKYHFI